jgi:predicted transcriptional regulator
VARRIFGTLLKYQHFTDPMSRPSLRALSRRERQIMEIIYRLGRATAAQVSAELSDPPSHSAVRSALWLLEEKGYLAHEQSGPRNVYVPTLPREAARESAIRDLVQTFFGGSRAQAAAAILGDAGVRLSDDEVARLEAMVERAKDEGGDR